jgi:adenosylcobinamide-GDP ribazoletransferase
MSTLLDFLSSCQRDFVLAYGFLTRLPVPDRPAAAPSGLARALRLAPLIGLVVGVLGGMVGWIAIAGLGLPTWPAALIVLAATVWITGALHEDGLADVADGWGGGGDRSRKLEIMRDSRIGTYGVVAVVLSIGLRASALVALAGPEAITAALIAAHCLSRGLLPLAMLVLVPARDDGLAATAGRPTLTDALTGLGLGLLLALLATGGVLGLGLALVALAAAVVTGLIALRQIGGYTGDVLGAVQQTAEVAVLLAAAAVLA